MQGRYVTLVNETCSFWPGLWDRDYLFVDAIWQWLEDQTCVDRNKAGAHV